ncbi:DUF6586 family protein [Marinimicrobium sp. ABcell2]|uniref:DUF6586 family protein n=1 Tax=Marinimicrobium sp. ABcell2 TaxID=3069751 RepID=UPI0027B3FF95|nr:DUF6586 family protein [Marinimicrobium sp. ABcell2]MDQ2075578.1 hypothetical protein [Marinimicrobium sp. ABcell2]
MMSATSLGMVNQKLAYARAVLAQLDGLPEGSASERLQRQALLDAGAFHLMCAYSHYLRELGENYALTQVAGIHNESDLHKALMAQGKSPAEVRELQELRRQPASWLTQLHASYAACWQFPEKPTAHQDAARIQAVDLEAVAAPLPVTAERLQTAYRALNELIVRQRESTTEW